jgi:Zn-finger nucleic acid-binding protein
MFDGAAFCPACGAARSRVEAAEATDQCPGCSGALRRVEVGKATLLECAGCDGAWIDADRFEALCADGEAQAAVLHRYAGRAVVAKTAVKYRRCIRCRKMMNRVNFARLSGTVVDVCRGHGTFLDAGELHLIVTFLRAGGMERSRQHQLDELRHEQQKLQALEARVRARESVNARSSGWDRDSFLHLVTLLDGDARKGD